MANLSNDHKVMFVDYLVGAGLKPDVVHEVLRKPYLARPMVESLKGVVDVAAWTNIDTTRDGHRDSFLSESGIDLDPPSALKTRVPSHLEIIDRTMSMAEVDKVLMVDKARPSKEQLASGQVAGLSHVEQILEMHRRMLPGIEHRVPIMPCEITPGATPAEEYKKIALLPQAALDGWGLIAIARERPDESERYFVSFFGMERTGRILLLANMNKRMLLMSMRSNAPLPQGKVRTIMRPPVEVGP